MKKLEEVFDMDSLDDEEPQPESNKENNDNNAITQQLPDINQLQHLLSEVDKIDQALPTVRGLEMLDSEMDEIKRRSMDAFEEIMEYGKNVEDKHAAPLFDSAAKMLQAAITANQSKMDRKLQAINLQIRKSKVDYDREKLEWDKEKFRLSGDAGKPIEGNLDNSETIKMSRNDIINQILKNR